MVPLAGLWCPRPQGRGHDPFDPPPLYPPLLTHLPVLCLMAPGAADPLTDLDGLDHRPANTAISEVNTGDAAWRQAGASPPPSSD